MNDRDKIICGIYAKIAIGALPATWINNIAFMSQTANTILLGAIYLAASVIWLN